MFKLNAKLDADSLLYSVILNVTATQYTCPLNSIYHPHWIVQWSRHCLCMCIPVHSPWLPGYTDVVLIILIMAAFFPYRPHIYTFPWQSFVGFFDHVNKYPRNKYSQDPSFKNNIDKYYIMLFQKGTCVHVNTHICMQNSSIMSGLILSAKISWAISSLLPGLFLISTQFME